MDHFLRSCAWRLGALALAAVSASAIAAAASAAPLPSPGWAMRPLTDPDPPAVRTTGWATSPIDLFILARLEEKGLTPSPEATLEALARRLSFILTGLPPTPEETSEFLAAAEGPLGVPAAVTAAADTYLASPHYGERWGRHWLDVARYADTAGESADYPIPQAYLYRNYVIDAFNRDTPYDQFLREQIAGDLLPAADAETRKRQVIATGFIAQARRFSVDPDTAMHQTIEDVVDTLGKATMGLSLSCARCHDHKFDPVSMRDYYALYGMFESTRFPFPGSENKKRQRDLVPLIPQEEVDAVMAPFREELAGIDKELEDLQAERKAARDKRRDGHPLLNRNAPSWNCSKRSAASAPNATPCRIVCQTSRPPTPWSTANRATAASRNAANHSTSARKCRARSFPPSAAGRCHPRSKAAADASSPRKSPARTTR